MFGARPAQSCVGSHGRPRSWPMAVDRSRPLVVVDADVLGRQRTGDESYVRELLTGLGMLDLEFDVGAITRFPDLVPPGIEALALPVPNQLARVGWALPRRLRRVRPDFAHFQYVIPPAYRGRSIITVHDISFDRRPEWMSLEDRLLFGPLTVRSIRRAELVLTVSEWSRAELIDRFGLSPERVVATPNGIGSEFRLDGPVREGPPYLLFVGAIQPRKDPVAALEALRILGGDERLLMVGPHKRGLAEVRAAAERLGVADRVELLGHVSTEELGALYRGAECLVFPSLYEGFGLPVLEAMACGTPVVARRLTAIPEVAGDAAVLVEPGDPAALAAGVETVRQDRDRLVAAGLAQASRFTWARTVELTVSAYRSLI